MTATQTQQPTFQKVTYDVADSVATITLNDPASLNALDSTMKGELLQALSHAEYDDTAKVIVLTGAGKGFSSGGDIREMLGSTETRQAVLKMAHGLTTGVGEISRKLRKISKPIIARINGAAAGAGMKIALACDFRVASDNAKFLQAFVNIGLVPDAGGIYQLTQLIGAAKTTELVMLGEQFDAKKAQDLGLVNAIVPADELDAAVPDQVRNHQREHAAVANGAPRRERQLAFMREVDAADADGPDAVLRTAVPPIDAARAARGQNGADDGASQQQQQIARDSSPRAGSPAHRRYAGAGHSR
jgi:2-(1,2-epoxy-1,2-dihydrophenyl)acetyl-CoA isomerase